MVLFGALAVLLLALPIAFDRDGAADWAIFLLPAAFLALAFIGADWASLP